MQEDSNISKNNIITEAPLDKGPLSPSAYNVPILLETKVDAFNMLEKRDFQEFFKCFKLNNFEVAYAMSLQKYLQHEKRTFSYCELLILNNAFGHFGVGRNAINLISIQSKNPAIKAALGLYKKTKVLQGDKYAITLEDICIKASEQVLKYAGNKSAELCCGRAYLNCIGGGENDAFAIGMQNNICSSSRDLYKTSSGIINSAYVTGEEPVCVCRKSFTSLAEGSENDRVRKFSLGAANYSVSAIGEGTTFTDDVKGCVDAVTCVSLKEKSTIGADFAVGSVICTIDLGKSRRINTFEAWKNVYNKSKELKSCIKAVFTAENGLALALVSQYKLSVRLDLDSPVCDAGCANLLLGPCDNLLVIIADKKRISALKKALCPLDLQFNIVGKFYKPQKYYDLPKPIIEISLKGKNFVKLPFDLLFHNKFEFRSAEIVDETLDAQEIAGLQQNEKNAKEFILDAFKTEAFSLPLPYDFSGYGNVINTPLCGKFNLTQSNICGFIPHEASIHNLAVVIGSDSHYKELGKSAFLEAVNSILVSIGKLIASGVAPHSIGISNALMVEETPDAKTLGDAVAAALGMFYTACKLSLPIVGSAVGEYKGNGIKFHTSAVATVKPDVLISNVFESGKKVFVLQIKRDEFGMPDFKYLLRLYNAINVNIETHNICAVAVTEGDVMSKLAKSLAGGGRGIFLNCFSNLLFDTSFGDFIINVDDIDQFVGFDFKYLGIVDDTGIVQTDRCVLYDSRILRKARADVNSEKTTLNTIFKHNFYVVNEAGKIHEQHNAHPVAFVPVLTQNIGNQLQSAFMRSGCAVQTMPFVPAEINNKDYLIAFRKHIKSAQIFGIGGPSLSSNNMFVKPTMLTEFLTNPIITDAINELLWHNDGLIYSFGVGMNSLIELGFLPFGKCTYGAEKNKLSLAECKSHAADCVANAKVISNLSPWYSGIDVGNNTFSVVTSGIADKFCIKDSMLAELYKNGQIATEFVYSSGKTAKAFPFNPVDSVSAIESVTSPDGRIIGKLAHPERFTKLTHTMDDFDIEIFKRGSNYFK